jgi:hypothetical protein
MYWWASALMVAKSTPPEPPTAPTVGMELMTNDMPNPNRPRSYGDGSDVSHNEAYMSVPAAPQLHRQCRRTQDYSYSWIISSTISSLSAASTPHTKYKLAYRL